MGDACFEDGLIHETTLTCPSCRHRWAETMPDNACVQWSDCPSCGQRLTPKQGDCCVYCSYGSIPCPPIQKSGRSCCAGD
ncbi:MAG: hypothetical protein HZA67_04500 [Rhodospirillales bacterium]|jgi:hypothetical protein|nr:hypothetical protein [Rhodospirillales bacterium]MDK9722698.1 hypothetical protein [Rhodospirillales bacterium]